MIFFTGVGSDLRVYETVEPYRRVSVPCLTPGTMIHGIRFLQQEAESKEVLIAVFGQKETTLLRFSQGDQQFCHLEVEWRMDISKDWIWDVILGSFESNGSNTHLLRITAHNVVELWDYSTKQLIKKTASSENSILYSASLYYSESRGILAACGTVFNQVCYWYYW